MEGVLSARVSSRADTILDSQANQIVHDKDGIVSVSVLIELRKNQPQNQKYAPVQIYTSDRREDLVVRAHELCETYYDKYSQLDQEWIFNQLLIKQSEVLRAQKAEGRIQVMMREKMEATMA